MDREEKQYLLYCAQDSSHCVVSEEDLIYNKKISLECGSTVWFMYKNQGTETPYRGTILEISDDGEMLFNLAQKFTASKETNTKDAGEKSTPKMIMKNLATKVNKNPRSKNNSEEKDLESAKALTEARKKASKLEADHIASEIKLHNKKSTNKKIDAADSEEVKLLLEFKSLSVKGQELLDKLAQAIIELEKIMTSKSSLNVEGKNILNCESRSGRENLKRNYDDEESEKDSISGKRDNCRGAKSLKFSRDLESYSIFNDYEDNKNGDDLYEISDEEEDYKKKFSSIEKSKVGIGSFSGSKNRINNKEGDEEKVDIDIPPKLAEKLNNKLEDLEETWSLKYLEKDEKTVELIKDSKIFVDKVALECAKKTATSVNGLARSLLELIFKKEALKKCTWNGGPVNGKGRGNKEKSPALNFDGRQTLIAYVTTYAENLGWNFNHLAVMQSLRSKIGGFKNS